jgi:hypothetical protein
MERLAKRTDFDPEKVHPHRLKLAAVPIWAISGVSPREIEHSAGRTRESGQRYRYEHISDGAFSETRTGVTGAVTYLSAYLSETAC